MEKHVSSLDDYEIDLANILNTNFERVNTNFLTAESTEIDVREFHFFRITEISFDNDVPEREAFEQVISSMNIIGVKFIYLLQGVRDKVEIYLGIKKNDKANNESYSNYHKISAVDIGQDLLTETFLGNFQGSKILPIKRKNDLDEHIFNKLSKSEFGRVYLGIPSLSDMSSAYTADSDFQTIERLINSMKKSQGLWQFIVIANPVAKSRLLEIRDQIYQSYNYLHGNSRLTKQKQRGIDSTTEKSHSMSSSKNESNSEGGETWNTSKGKSRTEGKSSSETRRHSDTETLSVEIIDKKNQEILKYIDEELLERISIGFSKGMFDVTVYGLTEKPVDMLRLDNTIKSLFQGDVARICPLQSLEIQLNGIAKKGIMSFSDLKSGMVHRESSLLFLGQQNFDGLSSLSSLMTTRELSLLSGLPNKDVEGISLSEGVDFGLNIPELQDTESVNLGFLKHRGGEVRTELDLSRDVLKKHVFIAGVTGSGKTTTCLTVLHKLNTPYLVIEPVKTEYRVLLQSEDDVKVYTLGDESTHPLRFNPFELLECESITGHVDMLKAAFTASYHMEAAMPYIMEEAIYETYRMYGWNIRGWGNVEEANCYTENPWNPDRYGLDRTETFYLWPTITDFLASLETIVKEKGFDSRLENDYLGSLVSRFSNLAVGTKGAMLNCRVSHDITGLLEQKVVIELDSLKNPQDKSLMMALLLSRINEALKSKHAVNPDFSHFTLIEEAHRLLSKVEPGEPEGKKYAVTMFTDMLAEIRKYGEGLIIIDQIPNKLAPDVLKNTNTKIIHRLFAKDDREAVGDSIGLSDGQKSYISQLQVGEVIVFSGGWKKSVAAQIRHQFDTSSDASLHDKLLVERSQEWRFDEQLVYYPELYGKRLFSDHSSFAKYDRFQKSIWRNFSGILSAMKITGNALRSSIDYSGIGEEDFFYKLNHEWNNADEALKTLFKSKIAAIQSGVLGCKYSDHFLLITKGKTAFDTYIKELEKDDNKTFFKSFEKFLQTMKDEN